MKSFSICLYVYSAMALFQRISYVRCYAFASRFVPKSHCSTGKTTCRGSSLKSSDCSETLPRNSSSSSRFSALVEESLSIAGRKDFLSFGGLDFRDCEDKCKVIFVLGGPGAGKGTQSELLLKNYPCVHLSAGQLLREEVEKKDSPHAAMIQDCLTSGRIVPVEISLSLLQEAMKKESRKSTVFLVDGFPRNFDNLDGWVRCMEDTAVVVAVLFYQCPLEILENRVVERAKVSGRSDDNLESLRKRFRTFEKDTLPVVDTLRLVAKETPLRIHDIRGDRPVEDVWRDTQHVMDSIVAEDVLAANAQLLQAIASNDAPSYQNLCADELFHDSDPSALLETQEGSIDSTSDEITGTEIRCISGTKVSVTYDVRNKAGHFKESRVWSHGPEGWKMLHFSRSSAE